MLRRLVPALALCWTLCLSARAQDDAAIEDLVRKVLAGDGRAEQQLVAAGAPAVPALVRAADSESSTERLTVLRMLARLAVDVPAAGDALARSLRDPAGPVRRASAELMTTHRPTALRHLAALIRALGDDDLAVRAATAAAIGSLDDDGHPAADALARLVVEPDAADPARAGEAAGVRAAALGALVRVAKGDDRTLELALDVARTDRRLDGIVPLLLAQLGPRAIAPILRVIDSPDLDHRVVSGLIRALGEIGRPALDALLGLVRGSAVGSFRMQMAERQLHRVRFEAADAGALVAALAHPDDAVALRIAGILRRLGEPAVAAILPGLGAPDARARCLAIRALPIDPVAAQVVDALTVRAADDPDSEVRCVAIEVMGLMSWGPDKDRDDAWWKAMRNAVATVGPEKLAAMHAIGLRFDDHARPGDAAWLDRLVPQIAALVDAEDALIRCAAVASLGRLARRYAPATASCVRGLADRDERVRWAANSVVGGVGASAVPHIESLLDDADEPVTRAAAALALANVGPAARDAVPRLVRRLADENARVRHLAAFALGRIGVANERVVDGLIPVLGDSYPEARVAARYALQLLEASADAAMRTRITAALGAGSDGPR